MLIRILAILVSLVVFLLVSGWLGLQVKATSFPEVASNGDPSRSPLPSDLPAPVQRFARVIFGDTLPNVQAAMVVGRAQLAPVGFPMPTRFRFYYDATRSSHYHDIQVTWFTLPFMRIHERNLEGHVTLDLSVLGQVEDASRTNRAGIQGYWSEVLAWVPSIVLTDTHLRWEAVDATTARLYLPGLDIEEAFTVRFDANSGLMTEIETMRYQNESQAERWRWSNRILEWGIVDGQHVPIRAETQWNDDAPWATWEVEQVLFNVDVSARFSQFGGDIP
ncbi:MAG: hypothetical protein H7Y09_08180 [Chitinophagaceae bacterium]|nr:hypothetical protein [Anaerolineae bacterium]